MAGRRTQARSGKANDTYLALVRRFPLRPIRTEAELDAAISVIDTLTQTSALPHHQILRRFPSQKSHFQPQLIIHCPQL